MTGLDTTGVDEIEVDLSGVDLSQMRMPDVFAWAFFAPGAVAILVDIVRLQISGMFLFGVVLLVVWAYLLGAFTAAFWSHPQGDPRNESLRRVDEALDAEAATEIGVR